MTSTASAATFSGSGGTDILSRIIHDLKSKNEQVRLRASQDLREHVESVYRELNVDAFFKYINDLYKRLQDLIESQESIERQDFLIDFEAEELQNKLPRFSHYIRRLLPGNDPVVMALASKALGKLAKTGGTLASEFIEFEVKRAFEWLQGDRNEIRRHAAVLILKELAQNVATHIYTYVPQYIDSIWTAIRDTKQIIREAAAEALSACLGLLVQRETTQRLNWYAKIIEEAEKGLRMNSNESIHGSLLTYREMLNGAGMYMTDKFGLVCEEALRFKDHKDVLVRKTVIQLIPVFASYDPLTFSQYYLHTCMQHLIIQLKKGDKDAAFTSIGDLSVSMRSDMEPYLDAIVKAIKEGLSSKEKTRLLLEKSIYHCISKLALAIGQATTQYSHEILDMIFMGSLSEPLCNALASMSANVPPVKMLIKERLLNMLSIILSGVPYRSPGDPNKGKDKLQTVTEMEKNPAIIVLALRTLADFEYSGFMLHEFIRDCVVGFTDDESAEIRHAAANATCVILQRDPILYQTSRQAIEVVDQVLSRLLSVAIADPEPQIREMVLRHMRSEFDRHLIQAENLRALFMGLHDEVFNVRLIAMEHIGRLTEKNPAYVIPQLRRTLIHLLTEIQYASVSRNKEEAAKLLATLISASRRFIKPYVEPILKVLIPKAQDPSAGVCASMMFSIGQLAEVGGEELLPHVHDIIPLLLEAMNDQGSNMKREAALVALGQVCSNTGFVIEPYLRYPALLPTLIRLLKTEQTLQIRLHTQRVLGILGALDPYRQVFKAEEEKDTPSDISIMMTIPLNSEEYLPSVAMNSLLKLLKDLTLSHYHNHVIQAFMHIFKTMGMKCVPFLSQVMPVMFSVMRQVPVAMLEFHFQQLSTLVLIVRHNIRNYLAEIFNLIKDFWSPHSSLQTTILSLVESIAQVMDNEFKVYLPTLLSHMLQICESEAGDKRPAAQKVLHTLAVFGPSMQDYLHLAVPVFCRLMEKASAHISLRKTVMETIARMGRKVDFSEMGSRLIHSLARVISTQPELRNYALDTLCVLIIQMKSKYLIYADMVGRVLIRYRVQQHAKYTTLVRCLNAGEPVPQITQMFGEDREDHKIEPSSDFGAPRRLQVNPVHLKRAWETSERTTKEDWQEWMRRLSVELLKESPSQALRACSSLGSMYPALAKELFNVAFVSCWNVLHEQNQEDLMRSVDTAMRSPNIPPDLLSNLLNLAEFMEHDDKLLPIDFRTLGTYAGKCHAFAKALHYREVEFITAPSTALIESLISINNELQQPDTAMGILTFAQQQLNLQLKESWYEKLHRWEDALAAYERRQAEEPHNTFITLGRMRCLHDLGEWDELAQLTKETWEQADEDLRKQIAPMAASAAWGMGLWDNMDTYISYMKQGSPNRAFFKAIHLIQRNDFEPAQELINLTRARLDTELTPTVSESYSRAYILMVRVQMLAELEEIIQYKKADKEPEKRASIKRTWMKRLLGCQQNIEVWQRVLKLRCAVVSPQEDMEVWIKFANLCRKSGRLGLSEKTLTTLAGVESVATLDPAKVSPHIGFAYVKHMWAAGAREEALQELKDLNSRLASTVKQLHQTEYLQLLSRSYLKQGKWISILNEEWSDESISEILRANSAATQYDPKSYKAWHAWALSNFEIIWYYERTQEFIPPQAISAYIVPAVKGFFRSLALSDGNSLQDTLRLLTLWFKFGYHQDVSVAVSEGFSSVVVDTWLQVIPQLIARIYAPSPNVRRLVQQLLSDVGRQHPQAVVYPLTVAMKSHTASRRQIAVSILDKMKVLRPTLVDQALMVSQELIRVSILWNEMWHEGLEEASRYYFGDRNVEGMFAVLEPLHQMMEKGAETSREITFSQAFGRDLQEARELCEKYKIDLDISSLTQAWDLYYQVFRKISKQLLNMNSLDLGYVSPKLREAKDLELAVPGTYRTDTQLVTIASFDPTLQVINSKQRPRKLKIKGSDGAEYFYLLKGHEDLRQDERVMQLFGLVNTLLLADPETFKRHLQINRYAVIPLSPNSGLIGWVPHCDTLHSLIKEYRESRKIVLNIEHRYMLQMAPDYDNLTLLQKVEVFEYSQENTGGQDLYNILWLKSKNSETWLERRTNYTRSLAVMSMVGYILGLGDRHPSNLMLDRLTGKVVHIDFGDCFEVAMQREKFPEKIPFRLTRMLVNAMEISGIEGNYRTTCEIVLQVLRDNKESLMAVLEAFVYDPLMNWLITRKDRTKAKVHDAAFDDLYRGVGAAAVGGGAGGGQARRTSRVDGGHFEEENKQPETLNQRAVEITGRISNKLTGRDFKPNITLDVPTQVDKLIKEARSVENLCQCYIGWCAFW